MSARPPLLDDRHESGKRHQHRAEHHRAVQVRPEHEQRQGQEDATGRPPGVLEHEPEGRYEEREGERLRSHDRGDRVVRDEHRDGHPCDREGRRSTSAREHGRADDAARYEQRVDEERELEAADAPESVKAELSEPLLVDPPTTVRPDGERVVRRQPVLRDPAARYKRHPAIDHEVLAQSDHEHDRECAQDDDEKAVLLEESRQPAAGRRLLRRSLGAAHLPRSKRSHVLRASLERLGAAAPNGEVRLRRGDGFTRQAERSALPSRKGAGRSPAPP